MFKHYLFFALLVCSSLVQAQSTNPDSLRGWDTQGSFGLNFNQVSLSNWAGGGESSISVGELINLEATLTTRKGIWENQLLSAYGLIRQGKGDEADFRKTDDQLQLLTRYNYLIDDRWFLTALADFRTQLDVGYEYSENADGQVVETKISNFLAPGFLVASVGATYKVPERFTLTVSPTTAKFTFVTDQDLANEGAFGVDPGENMRSEFGASLIGTYKRPIAENISFRTSLGLFSNYGEFNHTDVNWDATLVMKVNKFVNSTISSQLIYDEDVINKTQWRNVINVGFLYSFGVEDE
jgi:hypothetical protein